MCTSAQHNLARWLVKVLEPVRCHLSKHTVKDSFDLVRQLSEPDLRSKNMASFDIESLFTNVPLEETIRAIGMHVTSNAIPLPLPWSELEHLLLLCTKDVQFQFDGEAYTQVDGVAMGSPLGPLSADLFVSHMEMKIDELTSGDIFYRRYVDDILVLTDSENQASDLLDKLNCCHRNLRFTMEMEKDDCLPFLDILLRRRPDGSLQRSVYRKPTWTGQYLRFDSFVPISYKRGLVRTLYDRARRICSQETLQDEYDRLANVFQSNGYPDRFIRRYSRPQIPNDPIQQAESKAVFIRLPFRGDDVAAIVTKRLISAVKRVFYAANTVISYQTTPVPVRPIKDSTPLSPRSHCIYQYSCGCGISSRGYPSICRSGPAIT